MISTPTNYFEAIADLIKLLPKLKELTTRSHSLQVGVVSDNNDPQGLRRVKVSTEAMGQQSETYWIQTGRSSSYTDEPLPPIGTTVLIGFAESSPGDGFVLRTLTNDRNPPDNSQANPIADNTQEIPGNERRQIAGDHNHETGGDESRLTYGDLSITCRGDQITISAPQGDISISAAGTGEIDIDGSFKVNIHSNNFVNIAGDTMLTLSQGGASLSASGGIWTFQNAYGQKFVFGGSAGQLTFDLAGINANFINASDFTINGKSVATIGATDTHGDTIVSRGW